MRIMENLVRGQLAAKNGIAALQRRSKAVEGATAIEYALLVSLIAVALILAVRFFAGSISETLSQAGTTI